MRNKKEYKEQIELMARVIQAKIMDEINILLELNDKNRKALAKDMSTSQSFVSQLFSGDKPLNLKHLAQFEKIFGKRINISFDEIRKQIDFDPPSKSYFAPDFDQAINLYNRESSPMLKVVDPQQKMKSA